MAQRRMFSPDITESDAFLEMPPTAHSLYFHLGMYADDDGFVSPRKIMRLLGSSEDDIKILVAKKFVLPFENGVIVIKHWRMNNLLRKDWYRPSQYMEQKSLLYVKENGAYTLDSAQGTPLVNDSLTVRQRSIGKYSIGKTGVATAPRVRVPDSDTSSMKKEPKKVSPEMQAIFDLFTDNPARFHWKLYKSEREAASILHREFGIEELTERYRISKKHEGEEMCPLITSPSTFLSKMPNMENFLKKL